MEAPSTRADYIATTYGVYIYPNTDLEALEIDLKNKNREWSSFYDTSYALNRGDIKAKLKAYENGRHTYKRFNRLEDGDFCDDETTVFAVYKNFQNGSEESNVSRSLVFMPARNWVQAPTSPMLLKRFSRITRYSGKFLVYIEKARILEVWNNFKKVHLEGRLGYGLRLGAEKEGRAARMITVHIENCFDLVRVGCVAWEINQIISNSYFQFELRADIGSELNYLESGSLTNELYIFYPSHFNSKTISKYVGHFISNNIERSKDLRKLFDLTVTTPEFY